MPALSPTMSEGNIVTWNKKEGDKVNVGDILCEIQTDKATIGFESQEEGFLAKILVPQDTKQVQIGKLIGLLVEEQKDIATVDITKYVNDSKPQQLPQSSIGQQEQSKQQASTPVSQQSSHASTGNYEEEYHKQEKSFRVTPSAGFYLKTYFILPSEVKPTGPKNYIQKGDVLEFIKANNLQKGQPRVSKPQAIEQKQETPKQQQPKKVAAPVASNDGAFDKFNLKKQSWTESSIDQQFQGIASAIKNAKSQQPHSYISASCGVDQILQTLQSYDQKGSITLDLFLVKAASKAIQKILKAKNINISRSQSKDETLHYQQTDRLTVNQLPKAQQTLSANIFDASQVPQSLLEIHQVNNASESYAIVSSQSLMTLHYTSPHDEVVFDGLGDIFSDIDTINDLGSEEVKLKKSKRVNLSMSFDSSKVGELEALQIIQHIQRYLSDPDSMML